MAYKNCRKKYVTAVRSYTRLTYVQQEMQETPTHLWAVTPPDKRGNLTIRPDFCTSTEVVKWQPPVSLVPDPMKMSGTPNISCSSHLTQLPAIHPDTPMHIPLYKMVKKPCWKALSTCKSRVLWVQQVLAPISKLSPCHLTVQVIHLHWKQKAKESKETPIDLIGWFWKLHFCKQTSQLITDHLDNILELTWPSQWAEASFHWWDHD